MLISNLAELNREFQLLSESRKRWLFRGQKEDAPLRPSLERALKRFGQDIKQLRIWEDLLLREFRRHFHRYSLYRPADKLEWLTIMQHHGAPTRLLDWTYSPQVALFFAVERVKVGATCHVWAVENEFLSAETSRRLPQKLRRLVQDKRHDRDKSPELHDALLNARADLIVALNPFALSERLAIQQGAFLVSQSNTKPFEDVFATMQEKNPDAFRKYEITCTREFLGNVYESLHGMNMRSVSLFPGLDGYSRSFENLLLHPTLFKFLS